MDADGFTLVRRKSKRTNPKLLKTPEVEVILPVEEEQQPLSLEQLSSYVHLHEKWTTKLKQATFVQLILKDLPHVTSIVCFGLGSLHTCRRSQLQLAFLDLICHELNIAHKEYFDPIHSVHDHQVLSGLKFVPCAQNENGRHTVLESESPVLFFMPHCDRWLYSNLLESNAHHLERLVIIGNSFLGYCDRDPAGKDFVAQASQQPNFIEKRLLSSFQCEEGYIDKTLLFESFNDTCVISF